MAVGSQKCEGSRVTEVRGQQGHESARAVGATSFTVRGTEKNKTNERVIGSSSLPIRRTERNQSEGTAVGSWSPGVLKTSSRMGVSIMIYSYFAERRVGHAKCCVDECEPREGSS